MGGRCGQPSDELVLHEPGGELAARLSGVGADDAGLTGGSGLVVDDGDGRLGDLEAELGGVPEVMGFFFAARMAAKLG